MVLSIDVLDDVLNEIGRGRDIRLSPIINTMQSLSDEELTALGDLCSMSGRATFEQVWVTQRVVFAARDAQRLTLERYLQKFVDIGLIVIEDWSIRFAGDDREAMYAKYFARKRRASDA